MGLLRPSHIPSCSLLYCGEFLRLGNSTSEILFISTLAAIFRRFVLQCKILLLSIGKILKSNINFKALIFPIFTFLLIESISYLFLKLYFSVIWRLFISQKTSSRAPLLCDIFTKVLKGILINLFTQSYLFLGLSTYIQTVVLNNC